MIVAPLDVIKIRCVLRQPVPSFARAAAGHVIARGASTVVLPHPRRCRLQLQVSEKRRFAASGAAPPPPRYTGVVQTACRVVAEEGLRALWRCVTDAHNALLQGRLGMHALAVGWVPPAAASSDAAFLVAPLVCSGNAAAMALWVTYAAVQFPLYRWTRDWMTEVTAPSLPPLPPGGGSSGSHAAPPERSKLAAAGISIAAGAVSGNIATAATYPLDWIRTRFAAQGLPRVSRLQGVLTAFRN